MNKNEWLAIKVMGWNYRKLKGTFNYYITEDGDVYEDEWEPRENIEQAFMLLDKYKHWDIQTALYTDSIIANIYSNDVKYVGTAKTTLEAITEAVLKASGYYDKDKRKKALDILTEESQKMGMYD